MYPWEAGPDGTETTPRFAYQNALFENHVNGDVALAEWQYYLATGDRSWASQSGYPVIRDTADFWTTRVTSNAPKDRYEIGKVVSVIESEIGVNETRIRTPRRRRTSTSPPSPPRRSANPRTRNGPRSAASSICRAERFCSTITRSSFR